VDLWRGVLGVFAEHPLIGVGSGAIDAFPDVGAVAHNTFLSVLAELGIVGFILFLAVLMVVVHEALSQPTRRSVAWLTVLAVWIIGVSTLSWEFRKPTWLLMGLLVVSAHLQNRGDSCAPPELGLCENLGGPGV
jgi:O-antigen ligase